jgi:flagellar biosynthesis protein FliQ
VSDTEAMEDNTKLIEELLERATEYGKTSFELLKLKALDKTSDVISSFIPNVVIIFLVMLFMLFFNIGIAFWLGEILGKTCYGFFVVAAFYCITGIVLYFFLHKWLKKHICNYINKQVLK